MKAKAAVKFDNKWNEWCTHQNFESMYKEIYKEMVARGIAIKLEEPVWQSESGNNVEMKWRPSDWKQSTTWSMQTNSSLLMKLEATLPKQRMERLGVRSFLQSRADDRNNKQ